MARNIFQKEMESPRCTCTIVYMYAFVPSTEYVNGDSFFVYNVHSGGTVYGHFLLPSFTSFSFGGKP